jgi:hypothetical protein
MGKTMGFGRVNVRVFERAVFTTVQFDAVLLDFIL